MFDKSQLQKALAAYKRDFIKKQWPDEKYKWEAVQYFQANWDVNADDFAGMLTRALSKTANLLASANHFPAKMIVGFAGSVPEEVRAMFLSLYDESRDVVERVEEFKQKSGGLLERHGNGAAQHFQDENAIMTYLWLRYPDKYYVYKLGEIRAVAAELKGSYRFKKGAYADNIRNFMAFYDEICDELRRDDELRKLLQSQLTESCYPDPQLRTLTGDVGFYISRYHKKGDVSDEDGWWPKDYTPGFSVEDWLELLADKSIFTAGSMEIMKRLLDYGGKATCKQLAVKYGESANFYNSGSAYLARRIAQKTNCPLMLGREENARFWPVLYVGKWTDRKEEGSYIWKLRDELRTALEQLDLSEVPLYAASEKKGEERRYWFLNANPRIWSMSGMPVGAVQAYTLYNDNGNKRRVFQNFLDAKAGDMVIGYESTPVKQIVALARVSAGQDGERIYFEKLEGLSVPIDLAALKACPELEKMEYFGMQQGSLFKLTKGEYDLILDMIREENPAPATADAVEKYDKARFLGEVYISEARYDRMAAVLKKKKNIILQGAPGVGKTFAAKRLAYSIMGEKDDDRIEFIQFHQNYSYEDFIMGYKPTGDGFELKYGVFYRFCQKAANHPDKDYFFIIDEINRGNMSKIFGELLMLIEADYREMKAALAYNGLPFSVPKRLHIIGMMNTADRSLAMIDYALRRRFSFFDMEPGFDSAGFLKYQEGLQNDTFNTLIDRIRELNRDIAQDRSLGKGFCIGHSYFCGAGECTDEWMRDVVDFDVLPMLSEYWFDDTEKLRRWENILHGVFQ
ncbi:MAG TPA: AAA family ATPase [Candidatus Eisenbergiella merdavium]|uniref:AAA family ATPase n=1 Tax=Candidatus Eisenbergiella merdavium TaxID=2838551 RepID=A0A9D2SQS8_9FIRM|nr:AAA family ATPase [Candidatus Eisenbergiella merdavium]